MNYTHKSSNYLNDLDYEHRERKKKLERATFQLNEASAKTLRAEKRMKQAIRAHNQCKEHERHCSIQHADTQQELHEVELKIEDAEWQYCNH